ncbi:MAG: hypothetical protein V2I38_05680 [Alcanivoracaceae bacterium]|jgi:hypothetical protein|nr:hypothetical protein [Alcanivoracaceae bacterium]
MKKFVAAAMLLSMANLSEAGEFRGTLGYGIGSGTFENDFGAELTTNSSQTSLLGAYYFDDAAPFVRFGLARAEVGDVEINGTPLGLPDQTTDIALLTIGYRGGMMGKPQFFCAVTQERADYEGGGNEDFTSLSVGMEKSSQGGRYGFSVGHSSGGDTDTFGIAAGGTVYMTERLGFSASAGYSIGDGKILGADVDVSSWSIAVGAEFRLSN